MSFYDPRAGFFQICESFITRFLVFDDFLFYFLFLARGSQDWPPGFLVRDDGRQKHGAKKDFQREIQRKHGLRAQAGMRQISSCLVSLCADLLSDGWRRWVVRGLQHFGSSLRRRQRQAAAVILSCHSRRQSDSEKRSGTEREGQECERRFKLNNNSDTMH